MNEFPCNFSNLASVGDVIKVTSHPSIEPRSYYVGTVLSKDDRYYRIGITEACIAGSAIGSAIGSTASIPFGMLDDWSDRVTLVRASGSNRAIENLNKALDGAKSLIDGMLQRDEIQQREIAKLQAQLVTTQAAADSLHRKALTVDMVSKQRDDALREVAAVREDLRAMRMLREAWQVTAEKAQADYRDLQSRVLRASDETRNEIG